ncbi:hypothetical protein [Methanosarcina sp.]|jgi:hypothetical protein|uniref:hypothetical protein n=1 Tax=Methanosarcina sp. TaxID=2213 RepID=UPI002989279D|nr:hypothetical protein [Methanosarcina sp.]MDW5551691.1 hypothetical protein [Methanosarcina sp.]MDW5553194.1 hypothetical protein [Methanosarcina sp.]MDW5558343.1 hypothetical protein [Methanosarcina sp.]
MVWEVQITGDKSDLKELSKVLINKDLSITKKNEYFVLRSEYLDVLSDYDEVETKVIELLKSVNACAKLALNSLKVIGYQSISWLDEKGNKKTFFKDTCVIAVRCKSSICEISPDGIIEIYNQAMPVRNWIEIAQKDENVKKVFMQVSHDFNSWDAFYKIIEILEDDQFEPVRKKRKGIKEGKYRADIDRLTGTADSYKEISIESRHAREFEGSINNPMQFSEAKSFVEMILLQWLAKKEQKLLHQKEYTSFEASY